MSELPELRRRVRSLRRGLETHTRLAAATSLCRQVARLPAFAAARTLAAYMANEGEMDPNPLVELAWQAGKAVYLPIITANRLLLFGRYRPDTALLPRTFGILEPPSNDEDLIAPCDIDLVLTPLVAFDSNCNRVGMGGGYYDHTFEFLKDTPGRDRPTLLGIAYELQKVPCIARQAWDLPLQAVATERRLYYPQHNES